MTKRITLDSEDCIAKLCLFRWRGGGSLFPEIPGNFPPWVPTPMAAMQCHALGTMLMFWLRWAPRQLLEPDSFDAATDAAAFFFFSCTVNRPKK